MIGSSPRRLSDNQLRSADLRLTSVEEFGPLSTEPVNLDHPATVIGEYHLPAGMEPVRCALCPRHTKHHHGFLIKFLTEQLFAIGSTCGPTHLGVKFGQAKRAHNDLIERQRYLNRIVSYLERLSELKGAIKGILVDKQLCSLEQVNKAFADAAPGAFAALNSRALMGGSLSEVQQVRDVAAEQRRAEALDDEAECDPIFRGVSVRIGILQGSGFLRGGTVRQRLLGLSNALDVLKVVCGDGTDGLSTRELRSAVEAVKKAEAAAVAALDDARTSHQFFGAANVAILCRWSASDRHGTISASPDGSIVIRPHYGYPARVGPLLPIVLPALPRLDIGDAIPAPRN